MTTDFYDEEVTIDEEVRAALDGQILNWENVTSQKLFGGAGYFVIEKVFAILLEGVVAMSLPDELRARSLTLAGVSPFISPSGGEEFSRWVQFVLLLPEDISAVTPWIQAAYNHVSAHEEA